ncbi:MAG: glutamate formimidoyltransferase [Anaerolineales bacterium]|nr:glutamate formimidoyltransferase [Anaerolineales bacterium]
MAQLIECIPNFSEGRRTEVIEQIVAAAASVTDVTILDRSSDADHNRTVLTFVGPPAAVEEAAFRVIAQAAALIDMNQHTGEHPRIGATDVVPFVPLSDVTMEDCVALANRLGERVAAQLGIPVYLYEAAARRPERVNLENIRRGQYEGLKAEIETNPDRAPDYGPARLGPAGATVIGARAPLVAFNVYLTTEDVAIAKAIARAVRHSSGGFRFVKAAGFLVEGRAQVSMNLTDYRQTPIARVVETIRREAARYGVGIHHCELVGLIPQEALIDTAVWYTQLDGFQPNQVLETRLFATQQTANRAESRKERESQASEAAFLDQLAAATPAPGGGCAAAYAGAMGAALVGMMAGLTLGKKKYAEVQAQAEAIRAEAEHLRAALTAAVQEDSAAFEAVMAAFKLPKDSETQIKLREAEIQKATLQAARVPLQVAQMSARVIELAAQIVAIGNLNAISDGASGAAMARAALTAAGYNVRINLNSLSDDTARSALRQELHQAEARAAAAEAQIQHILETRGGISA